MKNLFLVFLIFAGNLTAVAGITGYTLNKATYLGMNKIEKQNFLKNTFKIGDNLNPRFIGHDNLRVSAPFKVFGYADPSIDIKLTTAAQKAFKQYEIDSRESSVQLVASVLYEPREFTRTESNPWAILISKKNVGYSGKILMEPVSLYSFERIGSSEAMIRIISRFDSIGL